MLRTVFFPQQLHRYVFTLQFMMKLIPVWKRQLTPYINAQTPGTKGGSAPHRPHLLRQWLNSTAPVCGLFFQQFLNRTYANPGATADLSD